MNRYNIRIDGEVMPNSYTYEELLLNDILDFDDIEIKQISKTNWSSIKEYCFPEEHENDSSDIDKYTVDENGQVHFNRSNQEVSTTNNNYMINEFGEVVNRDNIGSSSSFPIGNNGSSTVSRASRSSTYNSSISSSDDNTGWKVILTIIAILILIVIMFTLG
ncbi:MAG: hypothetical protein K2K26_01695 [Muribaculaceae bacterium]|nr:hypothetical protein [Muribaculaceae bacterium]